MSSIYVDVASMRTKLESLLEVNEQFKQEVSNLSELEQTLIGMWEGASKESFHTAFSNDMVQMNNFYNAIAQFASRLDNIIQQYNAAEAKNVQIANERKY